jgi:histone-lysine N-methyltransferase SETMAR
MSVEQRYVIKYWFDEGLRGTQIIAKLKQHYKSDVLSDQAIRYWIRGVKFLRKDLNNIPSPGRPQIEDLDVQIEQIIENDPHASARHIAEVLNVSPSTVCDRLTNDLGMKCCHLRWVPHLLSSEQKAKRAEMARSMLNDLREHARTDFLSLFTGDESWMLYAYPYETQWILDGETPEGIACPTQFQRKIMLTVFFNGTCDFAMDLMPEGRTMNSTYFCETILPKVASVAFQKRRLCRRKIMIHFDNAPIHNSKDSLEKIASLKMKRLKHPPYSPDLAPCDFFLFGYIKKQLAGRSFSTSEELFLAVHDVIEAISGEVILNVFHGWMRRLQMCIDLMGDYVESS